MNTNHRIRNKIWDILMNAVSHWVPVCGNILFFSIEEFNDRFYIIKWWVFDEELEFFFYCKNT